MITQNESIQKYKPCFPDWLLLHSAHLKIQENSLLPSFCFQATLSIALRYLGVNIYLYIYTYLSIYR